MKKTPALDTQLIHAGEPSPRIEGAVAMPIFQSSTFEYRGETDYNDLRYLRLNNSPNHLALHAKLAALEAAEAAVVTASGMAAITTTLITLLADGGHVLAQDMLYGGTHDFLTKDLPGMGMAVDFIDANDPDSWADKLRPNTRAIYVESMANPTLGVIDHRKVVAFAQQHKLVSMVDNTFACPVNFRPPEWGFDLSLHSATKYLNGHSDVVAGAVVGKKHLVEAILRKLNRFGGTLDPHACFLLHRGLKTLGVRVRQQNETTMRLARFLHEQDPVAAVYYPGLASHPDFAIAHDLFDGYGGVLSFELTGGASAAEGFIDRLQLPVHTFSLGGVETLIIQPSRSSHATMDPALRRRLGIADGMIRLAVGLEDADDLIADLRQALAD